MGGPENGNFPLLYVMKTSLRRWVGGSKKPQNTLRNIKMVPNLKFDTSKCSELDSPVIKTKRLRSLVRGVVRGFQ